MPAIEKNQIISLSGGKDSTAMLHLMLDHNEPIHSVIFFDIEWEFPQMYDHLDLIEKKTGIEIIRLKSKKSFLYWMLERPIKPRKAKEILDYDDYGEPIWSEEYLVKRIGNGWPSAMRRWCTRQKVDAINKYAKDIYKPTMCIGYAYDESDRQFHDKTTIKRFPLIEHKITEKMALNYCKKLGYHWSGLYEIFDRVSCFCCPLQSRNTLKKLRKHFPELWEKMLIWDSKIQENIKKMGNKYQWGWFYQYYFLSDLEKFFAAHDRQLTFMDIGNNARN